MTTKLVLHDRLGPAEQAIAKNLTAVETSHDHITGGCVHKLITVDGQVEHFIMTYQGAAGLAAGIQHQMQLVGFKPEMKLEGDQTKQ